MAAKFNVMLPPLPDSEVEGAIVFVKIGGRPGFNIPVPLRAFTSSDKEIPLVNDLLELENEDDDLEVTFYWLRNGKKYSHKPEIRVDFV